MRSPLPFAAQLVVALAVALLAAAPAASPALAAAVGDIAPAFTLKDLDGHEHSLADYSGKVVVLEWVNPNCPFSNRHAVEKTMSTLANLHQEVVWLGINSTRAGHDDYLPPAEHKKWAAKNGVRYAILYDESGAVGHAYGARTTPHMFILDERGRIVYDGAIDDDPPGRHQPAERTNYVGDGLDEHGAGGAIDPASTKPYGCSVKY
jgi:peroxiredoxin